MIRKTVALMKLILLSSVLWVLAFAQREFYLSTTNDRDLTNELSLFTMLDCIIACCEDQTCRYAGIDSDTRSCVKVTDFVSANTNSHLLLFKQNPCLSGPCLNGGICQEDENVKLICDCRAEFTGIFCEISKVAFYVTTSSSFSATDVFSFNQIRINYGEGFQSKAIASSYSCPVSGFYWLFYTVVFSGTTFADFHLQGTNQLPAPEIRRDHTTFNNYDTISGSHVSDLSKGQQLFISSTYPTYANDTIGSSWGAYKLDMSPLILFEVILSSPSDAYDEVVLFPGDASVNEGNAWNSASSSFIAPYDGIYYFSLSLGVPTYQPIYADILVTTQAKNTLNYCQATIADTNHAGLELASRGCLLQLTKGDSIQFHQDNYVYEYVHNDVSYGETSFRGFLYSPSHRITIAWSVHVNYSPSDKGDPIIFPEVLVNEGSCWHSDTNQVIISVKGSYFIEMVATTKYVESFIDLRLMRNNMEMLARLLFAYTSAFGVTRSRAVITDLNVNDVISISNVDSKISGLKYQGISFQGFLIYPLY